MERSRITVSSPNQPTASATSSFPFGAGGSSTDGFSIYPFTLPERYAVQTMLPASPPPFITVVTFSSSFLRSVPIMLVIISARPKAAVQTRLRLCVLRAASTISFADMAVNLTDLSNITPLNILSLIIILLLLYKNQSLGFIALNCILSLFSFGASNVNASNASILSNPARFSAPSISLWECARCIWDSLKRT